MPDDDDDVIKDIYENTDLYQKDDYTVTEEDPPHMYDHDNLGSSSNYEQSETYAAAYDAHEAYESASESVETLQNTSFKIDDIEEE